MLPDTNIPTNYVQFPNYHVGHHRLSADEAAEFNARFDLITQSGQFRNGDYSKALSLKLASFTGYKYAIPTDSGTSALAITAAYVNRIRKLNRVAVPRVTYQATYNALLHVLPQSSEIDTYNNLNPEIGNDLQRWLPDIDAIVTVGLGGRHDTFDSPDMLVIEDACQDWITKPHTGNHRAISFDPSKIVTGLTGGGAILTNSTQLAEYASHAISNSYQPLEPVSNRSSIYGKRTINEIDALHVLIMLESVESRLEARRVIMDRYYEVFEDRLLYRPGENHDMSKAILDIRLEDSDNYELNKIDFVNRLNTELQENNLGIVKRLYPQSSNNKLLLSLPLSERFEACPALGEMIKIIKNHIDYV